ncbi:hypothetical protein Ae201684P_004433 [Aphanomyces euteiches]|nr:hypothetical protein Ae201684P_004433 [Aphanomyces euteiches]
MKAAFYDDDEAIPHVNAAMRFASKGSKESSIKNQSTKDTLFGVSLEVEVALLGEGGTKLFVTALLDSGCSHSTVLRTAVPPIYTMRPSEITFSMPNGSHSSTREAVTMPIILHSLTPPRSCAVNFQVAEKLIYTIILGVDFLVDQQVVLDFKSKIVIWDGVEFSLVGNQPIRSLGIRNGHQPFRSNQLEYQPIRSASLLEAAEDRWMRILGVMNSPVALEKIVCRDLLTNTQVQSALDLLERYKTLFSGAIGTTKLPPYVIPLKLDAVPHVCHPYPIPESHMASVKAEIQRLVGLGVLVPDIQSPWASPPFFIPKKDGSMRLISDFRKLNAQIIRKYFPLPKIPVTMRSMRYKAFKTVIDLVMGYFGRVLAEENRECTAIILPFGKYVYKRLPMGLASSSDEFHSTMLHLLGDLDYVLVYLDDIMVVSDNFNDHLVHLDVVFARLCEYGMMVNPQKCRIAAPEVEYLGYMLTPDGIRPIESKVDAIIKIAPPKTRRQLKRFLGMINYYRDMLPQRAKTLAGLNKLTSPNVPFKWTHQHHDEFEQAKRLIAERTLLAYPDFTKPFHVYTDASKLAMGGYIEQDGKPIAFWFKTTSPAQANYAANKLELLSIVCLLTEFRGILLGHQLIIHTDHKNLLYSKMGNAQMHRWRLLIEEFGPRISYVPGKSNVMADSLSRLKTMDQRRPESICALTFDPTSIFPLDLATIADHQAKDPDIVDDMQLRRQEISGHIVFTTPDGKIRLPKSLPRAVFDTYHSWLLHPGSNSALNSLKEIFHWPSMSKNVSDWSKSC